MAELNEAQIKWLDAVTVRKPTDPNAQVDPSETGKAVEKLLAGFRADAEKQALREEKLNAINKKIAEMRDELKAAQSFQIGWEVEDVKRFWQRTPKERTMNWSEANAPEKNRKGGKKGKVDDRERMIRDIEVDTRHDLKGNFHVKGDEVDKSDQQLDWEKAGEQTRKLQNLHVRLVELQTEMEKAEDPSGKPLFTPRDIERELWSPLVKADIIPSNAVADKYSQEAQMFNGAAEVYEERLKEYSKKASKHETLQRVLRMGGDFVLMAGTVASASIRAGNFDGASMSMQERRELEDLKARDKLAPFEDGSKEKLRITQLTEMSFEARDSTLQQGLTNTAAAFLQGAFDITSKSLNKEHETKAWQIAEATFNTILGAAIGAVGGYGSSVMADKNATENDRSRATDLTRTVQALISHGLAGSKMIFRLKEALDAPEDGRDKFVKAIVGALADSIGSSFSAFDTSRVTDSNGTVVQESSNGQWGKLGAYISTAIISAANFAEIARMLHLAQKDGLKIEPGAIITAFGLNIIAPAMVGQYDVVSDKVRPDVGTSEGGRNVHVETEKEKELRDKGDVKALQEMAKSMPNLNQLMSAFKTLPSEKDLANKVAAEANKRNEAKTKAELKALSEEITKDPKKKQALIDSIIDENDERKAEINKLIALASSPTALVDPTAKNTEAKAAMDRLIAESEATKAKWAALDAITAGGVGLLVSFLPAAGLAMAIRQLVSDVAWLIKKSRELNLWQKNMALTFGNDSVYGPAIKSRLANAQIQVSQKAINVVFSTIGVTAESLRLGDVTGIATGISIGNTMARALTDYGYKMQKEAEIAKGWRLYLKARSPEGAGDRKLARKAMRWNSTLSKCVIAYGIVKDSDPIAAEVARNCGLSPEILADENDVCQRVVTYFLSTYSDDPVVMRRIPVKKDWHPAIPKLELENWLKFKAAAVTKAEPPLAEEATRTTRIDTAFSEIDALWKGKGYVARRDELTSAIQVVMHEVRDRLQTPPPSDKDGGDEGGDDGGEVVPIVVADDDVRLLNDPEVVKAVKALDDFLQGAARTVALAIDALEAYLPLNGPVPEGVEATWTEGTTHVDMRLVVESLVSQAMILRSEIDYDIKANA